MFIRTGYKRKEEIEVKDENGNVVSSYMNYTYTIKVKSSDEIKSDFVNFDETKDDENPINPNNYHSEVFDDMVKNTCEYFPEYTVVEVYQVAWRQWYSISSSSFK